MSDSSKEELKPDVVNPEVEGATSPEKEGKPEDKPNNIGGVVQRFIAKVIRNRMAVITLGMFFLSYFWNPTNVTTGNAKGKVAKPSGKPDKRDNLVLQSEYQRGMRIAISAYISDSDDMSSSQDVQRLRKWKSTFGKISSLSVTQELPVDILARNQSLWLHLEFTAPGALTATYSHKLVSFRSAKKRTRNLLSDDSSSTEVCENEDLWYPVWQSVVAFSIVEDFTGKMKPNEMPEIFTKYLQYQWDKKTYFPLVVENDFWIDLSDYKLINTTSETEDPLSITVNISSVSLPVFTIFENFKMHEESGLMDRNSEIRQLLRGPPQTLILIVTVSMLHSLFSFLAFKNDVQFWRKQKKVTGQSMSSMTMRIAMQTVIFLYLVDNDTSKLITLNVGFGIAIELWKVYKFRHILAEDTNSANDETIKYDQMAAKYLFFGMVPLLVIYSIYSLIYHSFKGYYNFVLSTLVRFIYWFGCAMMTPQLFVNYKLKSVAHMPWRAFIYKAITTFIDDIFAFSMEMPTAHRLATLRDDAIFLIYLGQYYVYQIDKTRINEFGQCSADSLTVEELKEKLKDENTSEEQLQIIRQALEMKSKATNNSTELPTEQQSVTNNNTEDSNECKLVDNIYGSDSMLCPSSDEDDDDGFVQINHNTL